MNDNYNYNDTNINYNNNNISKLVKQRNSSSDVIRQFMLKRRVIVINTETQYKYFKINPKAISLQIIQCAIYILYNIIII